MLFEAKEGSRTKTWSSLRLRRHRRRRCRRRCDWRRRNPRGCSARGGIGRPESHLLQHRDRSRPHPGEIQVQQVTNLFLLHSQSSLLIPMLFARRRSWDSNPRQSVELY